MTTDDIRAVLKANGRIPVPVESLAEDANLFTSGLTSLASVDVILGLEETFGVEFPDHMMHRRTFESISAIAAAIQELLAQKAQA